MQKVSVFEVLYYIPKYLHSATAFFQTVFQQYFMVKQRFPPQYLKAFQVLHHHTSWRSADRVFIEKKITISFGCLEISQWEGGQEYFSIRICAYFFPIPPFVCHQEISKCQKNLGIKLFFFIQTSKSSTCAGLDVGKSHLTIKRL